MSDMPLSIVHGKPLSEESGLGALTMCGWFREITAMHREREALVLHENESVTRWSYQELAERANEVARALLACGVSKGTRVGVLMTNRPEFLSSVFGISLAGGVATTLSTFSTPAELDYLLQLSGISVLLMERNVLNKDFSEILAELEPQFANGAGTELSSLRFPYLRHVAAINGGQGQIEDWPDFLARASKIPQSLVDATEASVTPADPGALFFSSGTTSKPKGILSAHRGVALQLWRWRRFYQTGPDARTWSANGFFWSGNFGMAIGGTLTAGGSLLLQKTFNASDALALMHDEKATMAIAWPHQWPQLEAAPNWNDVDLSAMKYLGSETGLARHPSINVSWQEPICAYGNTETFTISSIFESGTPEERIAGSSGEPQPGMTFKIVDPLSGKIMPLSEEGEIAVKGPTLMLGYLGIPLDETLDEQGFLRTGDGGYLDGEGRLFWKGRLNDIIKTGGANVSPREIDANLLENPAIKLCQTVGIPHDTLGEMVVSCIVPQEGESLSPETVTAYLKERLASYKVPREVLLVDESDLQTTGTAKIKTTELRDTVMKRLDLANS
jgi:acyl-CoA synthetase (AMP-forming)/AMP-acid ligase II